MQYFYFSTHIIKQLFLNQNDESIKSCKSEQEMNYVSLTEAILFQQIYFLTCLAHLGRLMKASFYCSFKAVLVIIDMEFFLVHFVQ